MTEHQSSFINRPQQSAQASHHLHQTAEAIDKGDEGDNDNDLRRVLRSSLYGRSGKRGNSKQWITEQNGVYVEKTTVE